MVLAIGIVVDDAIVVLGGTSSASCARRKFAAGADAALKAMRQVTGPIIAIVADAVRGVVVPIAFPRRAHRPSFTGSSAVDDLDLGRHLRTRRG